MTFLTEQNLAPRGHLESDGHRIHDTALTCPGVRGRLKAAVMTPDGVEVPAGSLVIIQPLKSGLDTTPRFKLTPYKKNKETQRADQPESQRDVILEQSFEMSFEKPGDYLKFNDEHYRRNETALFPAEDSPSLAEIIQSRVPDCFLLAAIQAVVNHPNGKSFIRGMMHQNDDGTTTVRLYDPETLAPEYIRVENSVIVDGFGELNQHPALWVHILEKAYAARGKKDGVVVDASVSSVYSGGGYIRNALKSLTGLDIAYKKTKQKDLSPWQIKEFLTDDIYLIIKMKLDLQVEAQIDLTDEIVENLKLLLDKQKLAIIFELFGVKQASEEEKNAALKSYVKLMQFNFSHADEFNEAWQTKSIKHLAEEQTEVASILNAIFVRLAPFSGTYTEAQSNVYRDIKAGLEDGKLVTASTEGTFPKKVTGLVARHAYTVLGVYEKEVKVIADGIEKTVNTCFVRVRNPWGMQKGLSGVFASNVGRAYRQHKENLDIHIAETKDPVSSIELKDFCEYFQDYDISDRAAERFKRDAIKEKCIADINGFVDDLAIDFTSSNGDLIETNNQYRIEVKKLIALELLELAHLDPALIQDINKMFDNHYDLELEKSAIQGLLEENMFPTVSGDAEAVKNHIYALLKLTWLDSQEEQNKELRESLVDVVQQHPAMPHLWEKLDRAKLIMDSVMMVRVNSADDVLSYMNDLANKIEKEVLSLQQLTAEEVETHANAIDKKVELLIHNQMNLEALNYEFLNLNVVVRNYGRASNNEETMVHVADVLKRSHQFVKPLIEAKPMLNELWKLRDEIREQASDLEKKRVITEEERKRIQAATTNMFSEKMREEARIFQGSTSKEKNKLGKLMEKAANLAEKIKNIFSKVKSFFMKAKAYVGTFFHAYKYEAPAVSGANLSPQQARRSTI